VISQQTITDNTSLTDVLAKTASTVCNIAAIKVAVGLIGNKSRLAGQKTSDSVVIVNHIAFNNSVVRTSHRQN